MAGTGRQRRRKVTTHARMPRRRTAPGTEPGLAVTDPTGQPTRVEIAAFSADGVREVARDDLAAALAEDDAASTVWVRVIGLRDRKELVALGEALGIHPLAIEDVVHTHQRPKCDLYAGDLFLVTRVHHPSGLAETRQVSVFVAPRSTSRAGVCVSFEEEESLVFRAVRERLLRRRGRAPGADYVAYTLVDAVVDSYFPALEKTSERFDALESEVVRRPSEDLMAAAYELKRDATLLRRTLWPQRDALNRLARGEFDVIDDAHLVYFRDCHDHATQVLDQLDQLREIGAGLIELHVSLVGNRMNQVMRLLAVISTLFIPLTFVTGLYGMNFDPEASPWNMPELRAAYGYPTVLACMLGLTVGLLWWFRRQGWTRSD
ncbi:MAG: magnesium/cobalt transporter CorA [Planctomycetota bacterium]|jgi:magnesium transporter